MNPTIQQHIQHPAGNLSTISATPSTTTASTHSQSLTREQNDRMVQGNIRYLDTAAAYDLWSEVYDTDGNFLQALDTIEMKTLLPTAIEILRRPVAPSSVITEAVQQQDDGLKAVDLGCGTGRNTLQLLPLESITTIVGLELSLKMLEIARQRCNTTLEALPPSSQKKDLKFDTFDMLSSAPPSIAADADLLISTLVLEHVPLPVFFSTAASMLRSGGLLIMTNMHAEMGNISQAGFVDPKTGDKIRPVSYAHKVIDTLQAAKEAGFELIGEAKEVSVDERLAEKLGPRGRKWIGVTVWYGGIWRKVR